MENYADIINGETKSEELYMNSLLVHTTGQGLNKLLARINGYENEEQATLRKKFAINNKHIVSKLLRPTDNIWRAKGGSIHSEISESSKKLFQDKIKNIHSFVKNEWFQDYVSDPNGLTYIYDYNDNPKLEYISSDRIISKKIEDDKIKELIYLFDTLKKDDVNIKVYKKVTDEFIITIFDNGTDQTIEEEINPYNIVPAVINSTLTLINSDIFRSPLDNEIELLNSFVRKNSVKEIFEFLHGFPKFWQYVDSCNLCQGSGKIELLDSDGNESYSTCPKCNGVGHFGKTDVSDATNLSIPDNDEVKIANAPMGFEIPPTETWQEMRSELDWFFDIIFNSHWGTNVQKGENETATGRFIDIQPVINRLNQYTDQAERVENGIINIVGKIFFPNSFKEYKVTYGRRFIIETADLSLDRYNKAKTAKSTTVILNHLLNQYYMAEYFTDDTMYLYSLKLMNVEPFIHNTIDEVLKIESLTDDIKNQKINFSEWVKTKKVSEIIETNSTKLIEQLNKYSKLNQSKDEV